MSFEEQAQAKDPQRDQDHAHTSSGKAGPERAAVREALWHRIQRDAEQSGDGDSERPYQTILPLSQKLQIAIKSDLPKGDLKVLVDGVKQCAGVVLIAWEHGEIPKVANKILGDTTTAPQKWPDDRFDVVWVFDWDAKLSKYTFSQAPQ